MKKYLFVFTMLFLGFFVFAQADGQNPETEIELPDVTTVISGGALVAGKDSVPDYKKILPDKNTGTVQLPAMDGIQTGQLPSRQYEQKYSDEKTVFAQGKIGGGFPFCFTGDFDIYRILGNSPFKISFFHRNYEDFADKKSSDGYFFRTTGLEAEKKFLGEKFEFVFSGWYKNQDVGLQSKSLVFTDYLWNDLGADLYSLWNFEKGWNLKLGFLGSYFNRYGTKVSKEAVFDEEWQKNAKYLSLIPELSAGWKNSQFDLSLLARYQSQLNMKDSDTLYKAPEASSSEAVHKGQFMLNFAWLNKIAKIQASGGIIIGNSIGKQKILTPFTVGADFEISNPLSFRPMGLKFEGGLDSVLEFAGNLEKKYRFSGLCCLPSEQTDWYGLAKASVPVKEIFSLNIEGEFRKTAFENGMWSPDYEKNLSKAGFYLIAPNERTEFRSEAEFCAETEAFSFSGRWKAFWIDIPAGEEAHSLRAEVIFAPEKRWNLTLAAEQHFGEEADKVPVLDAGAGLRVGKSIQLALEAEDIIKLLSGNTRTFSSSQYEQSCGHITALVKFQF